MIWHPYDDGNSVGTLGSESGSILRDEEHPAGARITLERGGVTAQFAITCGVYGWFVHTVFIAAESEALADFERMKERLAEMATRTEDIHDQIQEFVTEFP